MYVFELTYPGTSLDIDDGEPGHRIQLILLLMESQFTDAALALNLFEAARGDRKQRSREESAQKAPRRDEYLAAAIEGLTASGSAPDRTAFEDALLTADVEAKRDRWVAGSPPIEYAHRLPLMNARTFVYALDSIGKLLRVLARESNVPDEVSRQEHVFGSRFPSLVGVRDSAHHPEDRGLGRYRGKAIELKPIQNEAINAPAGGVLVLDTLINNRYGCTMADGHYGEVEVGVETLARVQEIIQSVLNAFRWKGPKRHYPT